jgi:hypothetical protein
VHWSDPAHLQPGPAALGSRRRYSTPKFIATAIEICSLRNLAARLWSEYSLLQPYRPQAMAGLPASMRIETRRSQARWRHFLPA